MVQNQSNGLAITALVVGIVAFLLGWTGLLGLVLAVVALVFGIIGLVKKQNKGMAIAGTVLGSVALVTALFVTVVGLAIFGNAAKVASDVNTAQQKVAAAKKDFAKGETGQFDKLAVKVVSYEPDWKSSSEYEVPKDGYEYVLVHLNIKNTSSDTVSVNPFDFSINDSGVVVNNDFVTVPQPLDAVELKSGAAIDGDLVYQVKNGATNLKLEYKTYDSSALNEVTYSIAL